MSALRITLARGGTLLLLIHALTAATALGTVAPLQAALAQALSARGAGPNPTTADLALVLELLARHAWPLARQSWPWLLAFALVSPVLTVALARALGQGEGALAALRAAVRRAPAAVAVRVFSVVLFLVGALVSTIGFAYGLSFAPELLELPLRFAWVALLGLHALGCATFHDLAQARLGMRRAALSRALMAALLRTTPRMLALRAAAAGASLACVVLADLASRVAWPLPGLLAPALTTLLSQGLLFAALVSRALFLQRVVQPAPNDPRSSFYSIVPPISPARP
jgi:hypothetical protein